MNWEDEPWIKFYTRETVNDQLLSWEALAIWHKLLLRFDRAGVLKNSHAEKGVAAITGIPLKVVQEHLPALLEDGRIVVHGDYLVAPNFFEAQRRSTSEKQRQKDARDRQRALNRAQALGITQHFSVDGVTERDGSVTNRDAPVTKRDVLISEGYPHPCELDDPPLHENSEGVTKRDGSVTNRDAPVTKRDVLGSNRREESRRERKIPKEKSGTASRRGRPPKDPSPSEAMDLAQLLVTRVRERDPKAGLPKSAKRLAEDWAPPIEKLHRLKRRSWEEIRAVLEFSQRDSFWQRNVLSGAKLYKQFETLHAQLHQPLRSRGKRSDDALTVDEVLAEAAAEEDWRFRQ